MIIVIIVIVEIVCHATQDIIDLIRHAMNVTQVVIPAQVNIIAQIAIQDLIYFGDYAFHVTQIVEPVQVHLLIVHLVYPENI